MTKSVSFGIFLLLWICKTDVRADYEQPDFNGLIELNQTTPSMWSPKGHANLCLRELQGWRGTLHFPDVDPAETVNNQFYTTGDDTEKDCIFNMKTYDSKITILKFTKIKLGAAQLKVKYLKDTDGVPSWKALSTIAGNTPRPRTIHVKNKTMVKIVVPKNAGSFVMSYKQIACHPLPEGVDNFACTKGKYVNSHCIFKCSDGYFPARLEERRFHARCTKFFANTVRGVDSHEWIFSRPNIEAACIAQTLVENSCLRDLKPGELSSCPYTFDEMLRLMEKETWQVTPTAATTTTTTATTTTTTTPEGFYLPQPSFSFSMGDDRLSSAEAVPVPVRVRVQCQNHCRRNAQTGEYSPVSCGVRKKKRQKTICKLCRYSRAAPCERSRIAG